MTSRCLPALAAGLLLLAAPLSATADDAEQLKALYGSQNEARGEFDAWLEELVTAVESDPESPAAYACLRKARLLMRAASEPAIVEQRLEPVLLQGVNDGEMDELLRDVLAERARARGDFDAAKRMRANEGYLRAFAVIGPFGTDSHSYAHRRYEPEALDLDLGRELDGTRGKVRWLRFRALGDGAFTNPGQQIRQGGSGVTYSVATVRATERRPVLVKVWCGDSFKLFVNGRAENTADRQRDRVPNPVWDMVWLEEGWNRVLVKVAGSASFALKLLDPDTGKPIEGLEIGDPMEAGGKLKRSTPSRVERERGYLTPVERARDLAAANAGSATHSAVAADLAGRVGLWWEALGHWQKAAESIGDAPGAGTANLRAAYGRFLSSFTGFPAVHAKLKGKEQYELAVAAFPQHTSAVTRLARLENDDDHPGKAVKRLNDFLAESPSATGYMTLSEIARARDWEREAIEAAENALGLTPNDASAVRYLAGIDSRYGNHEAYLKRQARLLEIDADDGTAENAVLAQLQAEGKHDEALARLQARQARQPLSIGLRARLAQSLRKLGREDESLAAWRELAELVPEEDGYHASQGEILEILGRTDEAVQAYEKSLALQGYQPRLWRTLRRIRGEEEDFAAIWEPNAEEVIAALPSTEELKEKYPKAVTITVLDHMTTLVRPDGNSESVIHMVYKLLDEKGVKKYGDMPNAGELLEIRVIQPDGTIMKPTGLRGRSYNMEGVVPGSIIQHRYRVSQRRTDKGYDGGEFYFQDYEFNNDPNPVSLSRFVVLTPKGLTLEPIARNGLKDAEVKEQGDHTVTIWENRDAPRIDRERFMPTRDEIVPHVDYSHPPEFDDANWSYLAGRRDSRSTPVIDEAVAGVVKDGMTDLEKLHAIYDFVNTEITGDSGGREGASAVLMEKSGSRALLFETMARTAGVSFREGRAMAWNGSRNALKKPDPGAFRARFLWLEPKGADAIPFFMGARHTPFGLIPSAYRGSAAFVADASGGRILQLPESTVPTGNSASFEIRLGADDQSTAITGTLFYRSAYGFKKSLFEMPKDDQKKFAEGQLNSYFASPTLSDYQFPNLEQRGEPLEIRLDGSMKTYLSKQGENYVVSLGLPAANMTGRFVDREDRVYDLLLNPRDDRTDDFTLHIGDAFEVVSLPESHVTVHEVGTYSLTWRQDDGIVSVVREWHMKPARYRADEYKTLVAWCKAIDDAEARKLVLRKVE